MKNTGDFYLKIFSFLEVKISMYLNRRVFVMLQILQNCNFSFGHPLENSFGF